MGNGTANACDRDVERHETCDFDMMLRYFLEIVDGNDSLSSEDCLINTLNAMLDIANKKKLQNLLAK